jgi:hypothetical protein
MGLAFAYFTPLPSLFLLPRRCHRSCLGRKTPALRSFCLRLLLQFHNRSHHKQLARQPTEDGHQQDQGPNTEVGLSHKIRRGITE